MLTTAQMYNISQVKLDELCKALRVYPIPDYERFFINRSGEVFIIALNDDEVYLKKIIPNTTKENGVSTYSIATSDDNIEHRTNVWLCARTFYGYFPEEYICLHEDKFISSESIYYDLGEIREINDDFLSIRGIYFKRIYYKNERKTHYFISKNGIVFNYNRKTISPFSFQHNMYLRANITIGLKLQRLIGIHRLVYNTWNDVWLPDTIQINHCDGFKYHNFLENLEESTQLENIRHAKILGLKPMPYSVDFINLLCRLIQDNKYDVIEMCELMGVKKKSYVAFKSLVRNIVKGNSWTDISSKYDFTAFKNQKHSRKTERIADAVCKAFVESGYDSSAVRNQFPDISRSQLDAYCRGSVCPHIAAKYGLPKPGIHRKAMDRKSFKEARIMLQNGSTISEVASHFGISENVIKNMIYFDNTKARAKLRMNEEGSTTIETIA